MELRKDLKLKYLTNMYSYIGKNNDEDNIFSLINEIKSSRKTKKNWSPDDFVFNDKSVDKLFGERKSEIISSLKTNELISEVQDGSYAISNKGLCLFFNI